LGHSTILNRVHITLHWKFGNIGIGLFFIMVN